MPFSLWIVKDCLYLHFWNQTHVSFLSVSSVCLIIWSQETRLLYSHTAFSLQSVENTVVPSGSLAATLTATFWLEHLKYHATESVKQIPQKSNPCCSISPIKGVAVLGVQDATRQLGKSVWPHNRGPLEAEHWTNVHAARNQSSSPGMQTISSRDLIICPTVVLLRNIGTLTCGPQPRLHKSRVP